MHAFGSILVSVTMTAMLAPTTHADSSRADVAREYSVVEVMDRAVARSPELKALALDVEAQTANAEGAGRFRDPVLGFGVDRRRQYPGDAPGSSSNSGATAFGRISVSQDVPRPGRLAALARAERLTADAIDVDRRHAEVDLRGRVLQLIYRVKVAEEKARHAKERFGRFATVETYMRSRPFVAPQSRAEVAIVKAKLFALRRTFAQLEAGRQVAWDNLDTYLGFGSQVAIRTPWITQPRVFTRAAVTAKSARENFDLLRQTVMVDQRAGEVIAARLSAWPGLTLTGEYSDGRGGNPERTYSLGATIPIPVLNGNRPAIAAALAHRSAEDQRLAWTRRTVERDVQVAFARYEAARTTLTEVSVAKLDALERDMREADQGFRRGQVDLLTYLETDAQHFDAVFAILDTQTDYLSALTELLMQIGESPEPPEGT